MTIRQANIDDIREIQKVRNEVKENTLSNPNLVTDEDCKLFLTEKGKGWVCEFENRVIGFSIVNLEDHTIWALFVHPEFEKQGVGRQLHDIMLNWYFKQTKEKVWLSTSPKTRAETFYKQAGWKEIGTHGKNEIKFEMTYYDWILNSTR